MRCLGCEGRALSRPPRTRARLTHEGSLHDSAHASTPGAGGRADKLVSTGSLGLRFSPPDRTLTTGMEYEETRKTVSARKARIIAAARINAIPHVILREGRPIEQVITKVSAAADMATLGIGSLKQGHDADASLEQIDVMLQHMPTTLLVHSAQTFDGEPVLFEPEGDSP